MFFSNFLLLSFSEFYFETFLGFLKLFKGTLMQIWKPLYVVMSI